MTVFERGDIVSAPWIDSNGEQDGTVHGNAKVIGVFDGGVCVSAWHTDGTLRYWDLPTELVQRRVQ